MSVEPPVTPVPKKGIPVLGWLAIGCGVLAVLGLGGCFVAAVFLQKKADSVVADFEKNPAKAAAEYAVRLNPEVELVSSTEQEITVRNKKTGEVLTVDFEDAKNGKFVFKSKDGEATFDADADTSGEGGTLRVTGTDGQTAVFSAGANATKVPDWVPIFTDSKFAGNYNASTPDGNAGAVTITTSAPVANVMAFYKQRLEAAGFQVQTLTLDGPTSGGTVIGTAADRKRAVNVVISVADGKTQAMVTFNEAN